MKYFAVGLVLATLASVTHAEQCDSALAPTIEAESADYRIKQAYMFINAASEYERLKNLSASGRSADASFRLFSAEYGESSTKEEFQEKVQRSLTSKGFNLSESDARQYYRRFLTARQLEAWEKCVLYASEGGGLLLSAKDISDDYFTLRVKWLLPKNTGTANLDLQIAGGTIGDQARIMDSIQGNGAREYIVRRSNMAKHIRVVGNMAGSADSVVVFPDLRPLPPPPKVTKKECLYNSTGNFVDFDGDGCVDRWSLHDSSIGIELGNGRSFEISPSPDYKTRHGVWLHGDFDGDRRTDLIQIVTSGVDHPDYAHVFCGIKGGTQYNLVDFNFRRNANPQGDYCVGCGAWSVEDSNLDGVSDLRHNSSVAPYSTHRWISVGVGRCGVFQIR